MQRDPDQDTRAPGYHRVVLEFALDALSEPAVPASDQAVAQLKLRNGSPREPLKYIIAETGDQSDSETAKKRGAWEAAFRAGRSFNVALTCDSWRDSAGALWSPNNFAHVHLPSLKVADVS